MVQCQYPSTARCLGWNSTASAVQCGVGYTDSHGSIACSVCSSGYFPELGACVACPPPGHRKILPLLEFAAGAAGVFVALVLGVSWLARSGKGSPVAVGVFRARDFTLFLLLTWQTVLQVGRRLTAAPPLVRRTFSALNILELDTSAVVHPLCYSHYPFTLEAMEFSVSLFVVGLAVAMFAVSIPMEHRVWRKFNGIIPVFRRLSCTALLLLYPVMCNSSLNMVNCKMSGGKLVLVSNPEFQCYTGPHLAVGVAAWFVIVFHVLGFPIITSLYLRAKIALTSFVSSSKVFDASWGTFLKQDYARQYFWFIHVNCASVFILSLFVVFASGFQGTQGSHSMLASELTVLFASVLVLCGYGVLIFRFRPYQESRAWKMPVKLMSLCVAALGAVTNFVCFLYVVNLSSSVAATTVSGIFFASVIVLLLLFLASFVYAVIRETSASEKRGVKRRESSFGSTVTHTSKKSKPQRHQPGKGAGIGTIVEFATLNPMNRVTAGQTGADTQPKLPSGRVQAESEVEGSRQKASTSIRERLLK